MFKMLNHMVKLQPCSCAIVWLIAQNTNIRLFMFDNPTNDPSNYYVHALCCFIRDLICLYRPYITRYAFEDFDHCHGNLMFLTQPGSLLVDRYIDPV